MQDVVVIYLVKNGSFVYSLSHDIVTLMWIAKFRPFTAGLHQTNTLQQDHPGSATKRRNTYYLFLFLTDIHIRL